MATFKKLINSQFKRRNPLPEIIISEITFRVKLSLKVLAQAEYLNENGDIRIERFAATSWEKTFSAMLPERFPIKLRIFVNTNILQKHCEAYMAISIDGQVVKEKSCYLINNDKPASEWLEICFPGIPL